MRASVHVEVVPHVTGFKTALQLAVAETNCLLGWSVLRARIKSEYAIQEHLLDQALAYAEWLVSTL